VEAVIERVAEALVLSVKQSPILLLGFVGGVMWARAMHRKLTQKNARRWG
jgi:hypothetical protein